MFIILRKTPHLFQHDSPQTEPTMKWKSTKERFQTQHPKNLILPTLQSLLLKKINTTQIVKKN